MRRLRIIRNILIGCVGVFIALLLWDAVFCVYALRQASRTTQVVLSLERAWKLKEWNQLSPLVNHSAVSLAKTNAALGRVIVFPYLPIVGREVVAAKNLVAAMSAIGNGAQQLVSIGENIAPLFEQAQEEALDAATVRARLELNAALAGAIPALDQATRSFANAGVFLRRVPEDSQLMVEPVVRRAYDTMITVSGFFERVQPLVSVLPHWGGFDGEQTHLFLFQNDTELRPTGGFIGNYGILRVRDGRIIDFKIDDTYNLDRTMSALARSRQPATPIPRAPFPLPQHLAQPLWFFRDVNWSPDFPETADRALTFYKNEGGIGNPTSVVALTTKPLVDLLKITGPVTVDGQRFTSDDVVDTLQSAVELNYTARGLTEATRKKIVNSLGHALAVQLQTLSPWQWREVLDSFVENLEEKSILLYDTNQQFEKQIVDQGWAGEITQVDSDFLMVVDANLASLKTDPAVDRTIHYAVTERADGKLVGDLTVTYAHHGTFTWKTTRLRNYVRVYVPQGSNLIAAQGPMVLEKSSAVGSVLNTEEHGKTVFGAFIAIEPGETKELHLTYELPDRVITKRATERQYDLYVQRQSGAQAHELVVTGPAWPSVEWFPATLGVGRRANGSVVWDTPLAHDQQFSIVFPKK